MRGRVSTPLERSASVLATLVLLLAAMAVYARGGPAPIVVGKYRHAQAPAPTPEPGVRYRPASQIAPYLALPTPPPAAGPVFPGATNVPRDLKFFLVVGTDARPGEDVLHARADSIHVGAVDPVSRRGTIFGIPRDTYVSIPGRGKHKINAATVYGGPQLLVQTVREFTGLPVSYYGVTGFVGIEKIVNALGGVVIDVPYPMHDGYSGADFEPGPQHMDGPRVLAFSRARHGVPGGDFGRSENHGRVILHSLEKMRKEVKDGKGMRKWLDVLFANAKLDMSIADAIGLADLARNIIPADLRNVVMPATGRTINGESVVVPNDDSYALIRDVGGDAVADGNLDREPPAPPPPTPKPKPSPTPTPLLPLPEV